MGRWEHGTEGNARRDESKTVEIEDRWNSQTAPTVPTHPANLPPPTNSDIGGRKWVYVASITIYSLVNIGCAKALNLPMLIIFQFLAGTAGSVALCNVAGTIADLFGDSDNAGQPMALFVASANAGPSFGSPIGEWIMENVDMGLPWIFWLNCIIAAAFVVGMCFLPETLPRLVIAKGVRANGAANAEEVLIAEEKIDVLREMRFVSTMALKIMVTEPIVIFLGLYNGFAYGLLFLYLDGVFDVFVYNNGLSYINADLTYLNFVVGVSNPPHLTHTLTPILSHPKLIPPPHRSQ